MALDLAEQASAEATADMLAEAALIAGGQDNASAVVSDIVRLPEPDHAGILVVMLTRDGGLKPIDLGVARLPRVEDCYRDEIPGTPTFMAPEQFEGNASDDLTDQFALGITLYRAIRPISATSPQRSVRTNTSHPAIAARPSRITSARASLSSTMAIRVAPLCTATTTVPTTASRRVEYSTIERVLQGPTRPQRHAIERIIGHAHRQSGRLRQHRGDLA